SAGAYSLQGPKRNKLAHVLGKPAQRGAYEEQCNRRLQHDLAAMDISQLSVERTRDGAGQQVRRHDPRQMGEAAEFADDGRQRGGHNGLIERCEQQRQKQRTENSGYRRSVLSSAHPFLIAAARLGELSGCNYSRFRSKIAVERFPISLTKRLL